MTFASCAFSVKAMRDKVEIDGHGLNAKPSSNCSEAVAFGEQLLGLVQVPAKIVRVGMNVSVRLCIDQLEVLTAVVPFVFVLVMHKFIAPQFATELLCHLDAVTQVVLPIHEYDRIAIPVGFREGVSARLASEMTPVSDHACVASNLDAAVLAIGDEDFRPSGAVFYVGHLPMVYQSKFHVKGGPHG